MFLLQLNVLFLVPKKTFFFIIMYYNHFISVPQNLLTVEAEPFYDSSSQLSEVRVHWRNQV